MIDLEKLIEDAVERALAKRTPALPERLTVADYARRWSISPSTVRAAIREKRLDVTRIGRAIRIAADAKIRTAERTDATARARLRLMGGGTVP